MLCVVTSGWWIFLGASFISIGFGLWVLAERTADGRIAKNSYAGIRLPSTLKSDKAWIASHRAARVDIQVGATIMAITGACVAVTASNNELALLAVWVGTPLFSGAFFMSIYTANKAAKKCRPSSDTRK